MEFIKMHGTGNDFIFLLDLDNKYIGGTVNYLKQDTPYVLYKV